MNVPRLAGGGGHSLGVDADGLRDQLLVLKRGQEAAARRSSDLLSRSEALELHNSVLDQKLELILEMLAKQQASLTTSLAQPSFAQGSCARRASLTPAVASTPTKSVNGADGEGAMIKYEKVTETGQVLHRRRKKPELRNAVCAVQLARQPGPGAPSSAGLVGIAAAAAQQRARRAQDEREELKEALNA